MTIVVKLIGIVILTLGAAFISNPDIMKQCMVFWAKGKRLYLGAALSIIIGILLLFAALQCEIAWVVIVFGILAAIKGIIIFLLGPGKIASIIKWWTERPVKVLRLIGIISLVIGALLICVA